MNQTIKFDNLEEQKDALDIAKKTTNVIKVVEYPGTDKGYIQYNKMKT